MPNQALNPDLFLARRATKGDPAAWEEIVERYGRRIYNLCLQFADHPAEAEDLTQDVFLKLFHNLQQYRGQVSLLAWALRLSRNLCIDHYRHCRRRKQSETFSADVLAQMSSGDDPRAVLQQNEKRRLVHRTLRAMPEELAVVVLLRDLQGFSYGEVAAMLELPLGTVKSRLNRARRELVGRISENLDPATGQVSSC